MTQVTSGKARIQNHVIPSLFSELRCVTHAPRGCSRQPILLVMFILYLIILNLLFVYILQYA